MTPDPHLPLPTAPPRPLKALVVDDEKNIRSTLRVCLEALGCSVLEAATSEAALAAVAHETVDLAFVDLRLGHSSGLDLVPRLLAEDPELDVVLITAYAGFDNAVEAIRRGARDYLPKPFTPAQIAHVVSRTRDHRTRTHRLQELEGQLAELEPAAILDTASPSMRTALALVSRAATSEVSVLLTGENGTGKGVLSRVLHSLSPRRAHPFVTVVCPMLSEQLLASELFGHTRGAFTGAVKDKPGRVEQAQGGTLLLDEVTEMSPAVQAQLLRFLQEKRFERMGEPRTRQADVRVVATTNRDLAREVSEGRFREDLLYRLNVIEVRVPALRERPDDILPLARAFLGFFAKKSGRPAATLSPASEQVLLRHRWPGNVRELRNAMERAVIVWPAAILDPAAFSLPEAQDAEERRLGSDCTLEELEREHILRVLARAGSLDDAARILGIDASTLYRKRKKFESERS